MTIAFVHTEQAFLPELDAYQRFFSTLGYTCLVVTPDELGQVHRNVEWFFMGTDLSKPREGIYKIHEYVSASVPPLRWWKDRVKQFVNAQPDFRLFQNQYVKDCLGFPDSIPWGFRDMGIREDWAQRPVSTAPKVYDFIYAGDCSPIRQLNRLLDHFAAPGPMSQSTLLILSKETEALQEKYRSSPNISFAGPVPIEEVPTYLDQSRFAINWVPDIAPFNRQTSTKFLDYAACRIPIITTRYQWVEEFEKDYGGKCFYLNNDLSNLTMENVQGFGFEVPDLAGWSWEEQIRGSGVVEFLEGVGNK